MPALSFPSARRSIIQARILAQNPPRKTTVRGRPRVQYARNTWHKSLRHPTLLLDSHKKQIAIELSRSRIDGRQYRFWFFSALSARHGCFQFRGNQRKFLLLRNSKGLSRDSDLKNGTPSAFKFDRLNCRNFGLKFSIFGYSRYSKETFELKYIF